MNKRMRKKRLGVVVDKSQYIDSLVERGVITEPEWILAPGEAKRLKSFKWGQEPVGPQPAYRLEIYGDFGIWKIAEEE